jgi:outer membrane PBP1 activator LpoA protein
MQRVLLLLSTLLALYACSATKPEGPRVEKPAAPAPGVIAPASAVPDTLVPGQISPQLAIPAIPALEKPVDTMALPHIALLLPLQSANFGTHAEAVRQGFMAAAGLEHQTLSVRIYSDFDENTGVSAAYRQAVANGAIAVVGPLTRNGVLALASVRDIPVPTLALNVVEGTPAQKLYYFGLPAESEAQQVAQLAAQQGLHQAIIISTRTPRAKRLQAAFEDSWHATGGGILREIEFVDDTTAFSDIIDLPDTMVFLAADAEKARLIRPYLPKLPIYATSEVFIGNSATLTNYDLSDIRFVDMPWLLQIDHPAVMSYARANPPLPVDYDRLYALGIDAFRLIQLLRGGKVYSALPLDGVTGQILLREHTFQRIATPAVILNGQAQLSNAPVQVIPMFPEQFSIKP